MALRTSSVSSRSPTIQMSRCSRKSAVRAVPRTLCSAAGPPIMVNGCTGKMGFATAEAAVKRGLQLVPIAFSATKHGESVECHGVVVRLLPFTDVGMRDAIAKYPGLIVVDYTHPDAVHRNSEFYCRNKAPFVMGTTGGDREKLAADVLAAGVPAVIAPQMGKQLVAFQGAIEMLAEKFPGAFGGYTLTVREAHQSSKADTSGTAKAIVGSFKQLGCGAFEIGDIERVRDAPGQLAMGVPEEHLGGHAYHTYHLTSPDGLVNFEFQHNVCGRSVYAEGTVDAAVFLAGQIKSGATKTLFNMIDVLSAGAMN